MASKYGTWTRGQDEALLNILGGQEVAEKIIARELHVRIEGAEKNFLQFIATATIPNTSGGDALAEAQDIFVCIDPCFKRWGVEVLGGPASETEVQVMELVRDGTFTQIFGCIGNDLDKLCLTQGQIKSFCRNHADRLRSGGDATFFLFKEMDQFFVARVYHTTGGRLGLDLHRFGSSEPWFAKYHHRLVLPVLI